MIGFLLICALLAAVMLMIAWCVADELPKGDWFNEAVGRGVASGLADAFSPGGAVEARIAEVSDQAWREIAAENKRVVGPLSPAQFIWQMAFHMMRTDRTMTAPQARDRAVVALHSFLRDEKIKFGNRAYAWDQDAAETLARELETDHWEAA